MQMIQNRRQFLAGLSAAGAAGLLGARTPLAAEPPPEVTTIRFTKIPGICLAPQYVAEALLLAEGFEEVRYVAAEPGFGLSEAVARGEVDFTQQFAPLLVIPMDAREPLTVVAGVHIGCFELFASESLRSMLDLRGRTVGVQGIGSTPHVFLSAMATYVGLDPVNDVEWVTSPEVRPMQLFIEGKIDAFLAFPPEGQELRERGIGHVIINSALDRPWSQYYCCLLAGNRDFVRRHPVATKRVVRAVLKAADLCVSEPERVAQSLIDGGFTPRYDFALQAMNELPYDVWREYDPEDTLRFYSLRLHEAGMVRSTPSRIIADGSDWRFLEELRRELKT
jgi:NitT/TauT family transport system substrate-binding protein